MDIVLLKNGVKWCIFKISDLQENDVYWVLRRTKSDFKIFLLSRDPGVGEGAEDSLALVPFLDLLNHSGIK